MTGRLIGPMRGDAAMYCDALRRRTALVVAGSVRRGSYSADRTERRLQRGQFGCMIYGGLNGKNGDSGHEPKT